ncbi:MAG: S1/P1 nuclease [Bergeyella cardium]
MGKINLKLLMFIGLLMSSYVFSWGITGHRVIAEIAERHLTKKSKKELRKLFGKEKMAYWANWPDAIKSDSTDTWKDTFVWHYINVEPQADFAAFKTAVKAQNKPNVYNQILALSETIKDKKRPKEERKTAIIFLIHLMGDLSQPMHTGRAEDLGGNKIEITYFGSKTNLHSLWDSKLIDAQKYSYTEYATLLDTKNKEEIKAIQSGTLMDWLYASHKAANKLYAATPAGSKLGYEYQYKFTPLLEEQLRNGGLRLAKVLNELLRDN